MGQLAIPTAVYAFVTNTISKQIDANKDFLEKQLTASNATSKEQIAASKDQIAANKEQIAANKESLEKQLIGNKESLEKQLIGNKEQIAANKEISDKQIAFNREMIAESIKSFQSRLELIISDALNKVSKRLIINY